MKTIMEMNFLHANEAFGSVKPHLSPGVQHCSKVGAEQNTPGVMLGSLKFK